LLQENYAAWKKFELSEILDNWWHKNRKRLHKVS
jgi:hypothetical protein